MIPTQEIRPKGWWYGVGGGLIGLGVIAAIVVFAVAFREPFQQFQELTEDIDSFQRIAAPGEGVVSLDDPGEFVVYVESFGSTAPFGAVVESSITIESVEPDSTPVDLRSRLIDESYNFGGPAGRAVFEFTVDEPGQYRVVVTDVPPDVATVAVGPPLDLFGAISSVFVAILVPIGVGGVLVVAGGIVLIVTAVRRSGSARRLRMSAGPPPSAWGVAPGGYPQTGYSHPGYQPPGYQPQPPPAPSAWPPAATPPAWPPSSPPPPPPPPSAPPPP